MRSVTTDVVLFAGIDRSGGIPRTAFELNNGPDPAAQVRGSPDGRYLTADRPALIEGRLPTGRNEALVTEEVAEAEDVEVGDVLPLSFWGRVPGTDLHPDFVEPDQADEVVFPPLGVEHLTVVGIGVLSDEVLPDDLYPRADHRQPRRGRPLRLPGRRAGRRRHLRAGHRRPDRGSCAVQYGYYSIELADGARGVTPMMDAFLDRATELNAELPQAVRNQGAGYFLIATTTAQERERVERSIQPVVAALWVLAGVAAAVTVAVTGLAVARELRRSDDDLAQWLQLGVTTPERARVVAAPVLAAVGAGLLVAVVAAWLLSPIGPVGSVRSVDPAPARQLSAVVAAGATGLALVAAAGIVLLTVRTARAPGGRSSRRAGRALAAPADPAGRRRAGRRWPRASAPLGRAAWAPAWSWPAAASRPACSWRPSCSGRVWPRSSRPRRRTAGSGTSR